MKTINGLEDLRRWVINTDEGLRQKYVYSYSINEVHSLHALVDGVSAQIKSDYPFYSTELPLIIRNTFNQNMDGSISLNVAAFGELYIIVKHLHDEPSNTSFWPMIHPRIADVAKDLFLDAHYAPAANRALVEVEARLRELFRILKPDAKEPNRVGDLIGALLMEKGVYQFCDTSTPSGRDYRKGVQCLFEGAFSAYRNPSSHANLDVSKEDSFAQIVLASQLMDVLEPR